MMARHSLIFAVVLYFRSACICYRRCGDVSQLMQLCIIPIDAVEVCFSLIYLPTLCLSDDHPGHVEG